MSWVGVPPEQLFFHFPWEKLFGLAVLPCFDLCRSKSFHVDTLHTMNPIFLTDLYFSTLETH